ncbi:hypothetical protein [Microbacterium sp. Leaf320]|uniref:hypothetical protein n=1 Tax=Microbacterium sp. Leaf320 TaxID=1736334 RepID=UPI0006FF4DAD|nr:hypothetical protein [Microbacterium sp. Leaf320]KQQ67073.1 hypothetical protein ASF63_07525 [Microbacterium sp. Leaf320]
MSSSVRATTESSTRRKRWVVRRRVVLLLSLFVIPFAISALLNSYGPLTADSAIRMAFATVAGQTIAIGGAVAALVITVVSRRSIPGVIFFALIALVVTMYAFTVMEGAGELLLERLDLVAETARLN